MEVAPDEGSMTTMPVPLGASERMTPLGRVMGGPPAENKVPEMRMLVAEGEPGAPSPRIAVAVIVEPLGRVKMTPAVGVGAPPGRPMGWGMLMVEGAAPPGVDTMMCVGSRMETVVPGPRVMPGPPGVRTVVPILIWVGFAGFTMMGVMPMEPIVVGCGTAGGAVTPGRGVVGLLGPGLLGPGLLGPGLFGPGLLGPGLFGPGLF